MGKLDMKFINSQISGVYEQDENLKNEISRAIDIKLGEVLQRIKPKVEDRVREEFAKRSKVMQRKLETVETIKGLQQSLKIAKQRFAVKGENIRELDNNISLAESKIVEIDDNLQNGRFTEEERQELLKQKNKFVDNINRDSEFKDAYYEELQNIYGQINSIMESLEANSMLLTELDSELAMNEIENSDVNTVTSNLNAEESEKTQENAEAVKPQDVNPQNDSAKPKSQENDSKKEKEEVEKPSMALDANNSKKSEERVNTTSDNQQNPDVSKEKDKGNTSKSMPSDELDPKLVPNLEKLQAVAGNMFNREELEEIVKYFYRVAGDYADYDVIINIMTSKQIAEDVNKKLHNDVKSGKLKIDYVKSTSRDMIRNKALSLVTEYGDLLSGKKDQSENINIVYNLKDRKDLTNEELERLEELAYRARNFATIKAGIQTKMKWKRWDAENRRLAEEAEEQENVTVVTGTSSRRQGSNQDKAHEEYVDELKVNSQDNAETSGKYGIFDAYEQER